MRQDIRSNCTRRPAVLAGMFGKLPCLDFLRESRDLNGAVGFDKNELLRVAFGIGHEIGTSRGDRESSFARRDDDTLDPFLSEGIAATESGRVRRDTKADKILFRGNHNQWRTQVKARTAIGRRDYL